MSDPFRPPRRRRLLWPLLISVVVVVALAMGLTLGSDGSSALYVEDLREQASTMARKAGTFRDMLERMAVVDRVELVEVTDDIEATGAAVTEFLAAETSPDTLVGPVAVFSLAVESWVRGTATFRDSLLRAADDPTVTSNEALIEALLDLRGGDRLYRLFLEEVAVDEEARPITEMPAVAFLPDGYPIASSARTLAGQASAPGSPLELRPSLRLQQITTSPEWVLDTENRLVVEEVSALTVKVVVANQGNAPAAPSTVALTLTDTDGAVQELTLPVEPLPPGAQTTLSFADLAVVPGGNYQLVVRLPLQEGEAETEDNARALAFRVNEPTPGSSTTTTTSG